MLRFTRWTRAVLVVLGVLAAAPLAFAASTIAQMYLSRNPPSTAAGDATIYVDVAAYATNEKVMALSSSAFLLDKEGDITAHDVTVSGTYTIAALTGTGQILTTLNPASTAITNASILANPAACASNEVLVGAAVNGSAVGKIDCEGDTTIHDAVVGGTLGVTGISTFAATTQAGQLTCSKNPADTTAANASVFIDVSGHAANEKAIALTAAWSIDAEGDEAVHDVTAGGTLGVTGATTLSGATGAAGQLTCSKNPSDTTAANASLFIDVSAHAANEKALAVGSVATLDKEGDLVVVDATVDGALTVTGATGCAAVTATGIVSTAGGLTLATVAARPACSVTYRGMLYATQGGGGAADTVAVCAKDAGDAYAWRTIY